MSPNTPITGWHATDDDNVPVRSSGVQTNDALRDIPSIDISHGAADHIVLQSAGAHVKTAPMRLSAFLGVALVLGAIGMYVGFGSLTGDLTGGDTQTPATTVEITAEGFFSPDNVTLRHGDTLTLINKNPDPQVIKSKDGTELFPVQVLFDTSFDFIVPETANGTYTYFSETLPEDRTLTITIDTVVADPALDIPIPFGSETTVIVPVTESSSSSSSVSSVPAIAAVSVQHSSETATISIADRSAPEPTDDITPANVPVNPYTVSSGLTRESTVAATTERLHSGAQLQPLVTHKPATVTETGPAGALLMILPALLGVAFLYRKMTVA